MTMRNVEKDSGQAGAGDGVKECSLQRTIAPCGLVCGLCVHHIEQQGSCDGCGQGGGPDEDCHQQTCSAARGLSGCWNCDEFPCDHGFFAHSDRAWRGLCVGSVEAIQALGRPTFIERMVATYGPVIDYGDLRHQSTQAIRQRLCERPADDIEQDADK